MNDSWDFQDAESARSGHSHLTSQPVSFQPHPIPGGMLSRSIGMPSRREGPPSIWDTHGKSGNVFVNPAASSSAPYPQELNPWFGKSRTDSLINGGKEWESNTSSRSEMPVWTKVLSSPVRETLKELWFRQIPYTSNVCLLEDKIQDWGMYLLTISYGSYAMDQRSGDGWFSGWLKVFVICKRNSNAEFWSTWIVQMQNTRVWET